VLGGAETKINVLHIFMRQVTVCGILMESTEELHKLANALEAWQVHPYIDRVFPFDQARQAYAHLHSQQHIGKVVIEVR
jgi:NADPH:quinone reductase-like Zn-dependent oxidoreductase